MDDLKRVKSINNYISKRLALIRKREKLQKQIDDLRKEMKMIDQTLPKSRFNACPLCDYVLSTKQQLSDHIYNFHAY